MKFLKNGDRFNLFEVNNNAVFFNAGLTTIHNVQIEIKFSEGLKLNTDIPFVPSQGSFTPYVDEDGGTWSIASVAPGARFTENIHLEVVDSTKESYSMILESTWTEIGKDLYPQDNTIIKPIHIATCADVAPCVIEILENGTVIEDAVNTTIGTQFTDINNRIDTIENNLNSNIRTQIANLLVHEFHQNITSVTLDDQGRVIITDNVDASTGGGGLTTTQVQAIIEGMFAHNNHSNATVTRVGNEIIIQVSGGTGGIQGPAGDSAYQTWLDEGNTGTEQDFLNSLQGPQGPAGADGTDGTQGPKGDKGDKGDDGITPSPIWTGTSLAWDTTGDGSANTTPVELNPGGSSTSFYDEQFLRNPIIVNSNQEEVILNYNTSSLVVGSTYKGQVDLILTDVTTTTTDQIVVFAKAGPKVLAESILVNDDSKYRILKLDFIYTHVAGRTLTIDLKTNGSALATVEGVSEYHPIITNSGSGTAITHKTSSALRIYKIS